MTDSMDLFERTIRKLMGMPEKLLSVCMEQYQARMREKEARIKAENIAEERRRANEAMASGLRKEREGYKKAEKELERLRKQYEEKTRRMEALAYDKKQADERYDRASEELSDLRAEIEELVRRLSDADMEREKAGMELDSAMAEAECAREDAERLQGRLTIYGKARFDTTSEKTRGLFAGTAVEDDPLGEDADPALSANHSAEAVIRRLGQRVSGLLGSGSGPKRPGRRDYDERGRRRKGKQEEDLKKIHLHVDDYNYTKEELDREFQEGRYRVFGHNRKQTMERTRPTVYVRNEYSPKVEIRDGDGKRTGVRSMASKNGFSRRNSKASASVVTSTFYDKGALGIPLYRQEKQYESLGVPISRQTMSNWYIHYGRTVFVPIQRCMMRKLDADCQVRQCDETTWKVVIWPEEKDGKGNDIKKKNGSRGYVWVHTTGEFTKGPRVVVYQFDRSRGTEHLRRNVRKGLRDLVYMICDAYSAYKALEREGGGTVILCGCWMHCRRKMAKAVDVLKPWMDKAMSENDIMDMPEVMGLVLASDIFCADTPLKSLSAKERHRRRQTEVSPLVDRFFEFVHGVDPEDKRHSDKFREAVSYAINNETELRRFLENGNIPMDNGLCERKIKTIALVRKNSLFSFSMTGAEVNAAVCTAIETARANGADVYTYLRYLITEIPNVPADAEIDESGIPADCSYLADMMPWSKKYRAYEKYHLENHIDEVVPESNEPPEGVMSRTKSV